MAFTSAAIGIVEGLDDDLDVGIRDRSMRAIESIRIQEVFEIERQVAEHRIIREVERVEVAVSVAVGGQRPDDALREPPWVLLAEGLYAPEAVALVRSPVEVPVEGSLRRRASTVAGPQAGHALRLPLDPGAGRVLDLGLQRHPLSRWNDH